MERTESIKQNSKKYFKNCSEFLSQSYDFAWKVIAPKPEVKETPLEGKDAWDIKVPIKMELLKVLLVKGLQSRNVMGTIFSYVSYNYEVISLMQVISHSSRAYIWNADALQGYLA